MTEYLECRTCGKEFPRNPRGRKALYCSWECKRGASHPPTGIGKMTTCPCCGIIFEKMTYGHVYCSRQCSSRHHHARAKMDGRYEARKKSKRDTTAAKCPVFFPICKECGRLFSAREAHVSLCSDECRREAAQQVRQRHEHSQERIAYRKSWYTAKKKDERWLEKERVRHCEVARRIGWTESRAASYQRRRALKRQVPAERVYPSTIFERDHWRCHICRKNIDRNLCSPHPFSASLDHVIPLAAGGPHTASNLRAAHLRCNLSKGASLKTHQLALFG